MNLDDPSELKRRLGFGVNLNSDADRKRLTEIINAKFWFRGQPIVGDEEEFQLLKLTRHLLANFQEKNRLLADYLCPADARIQAFLDRYLSGTGEVLGGSIVGRHAAELISVISIAVTASLTVRDIYDSLLVHPTLAELITDAAE